MRLIIINIQEQDQSRVLQALGPFVPPERITIYEPITLPEDKEDDALDALAQKIVKVIRPKSTQRRRQEALQALLGHHDTFADQEGEADHSLRNGIGAISKALQPVFAHKQASRRLAVPKKILFPDGSYKGTIYVLTPLGERVRDILKAENLI